MSLSDCPRCYDTLCCCGYQYGEWSEDRLENQIKMLQNVLKNIRDGYIQEITIDQKRYRVSQSLEFKKIHREFMKGRNKI